MQVEETMPFKKRYQEKIFIYNRWGNLIFEYTGSGSGYLDTSVQWDGTWNGNDVPLGSYVYIVNILNSEDNYNGTVTVKR